ncbi:hypothetical protein GXP70_23255 [Paenibacillus lycopersici]|uniref:Uncharacterized protein n=1 Tax=Paenibacillus lycopersici TaxID=2704462 RepID=A0A6C0G512_9BACL|nr:hypothetical protein [Paenibacillus lycopersici]QHT62609.1 hypothetical protein GXP70_23255 [Paenibacillus lycopersici]
MDRNRLEREARIALLGALSRSQTAVARILESVGDMARIDPGLAMSIRRNLKSLAAMQHSLNGMVRAMERRPAQRRTGKPTVNPAAKPWLSRQVNGGLRRSAAGVQRRKPKWSQRP